MPRICLARPSCRILAMKTSVRPIVRLVTAGNEDGFRVANSVGHEGIISGFTTGEDERAGRVQLAQALGYTGCSRRPRWRAGPESHRLRSARTCNLKASSRSAPPPMKAKPGRIFV